MWTPSGRAQLVFTVDGAVPAAPASGCAASTPTTGASHSHNASSNASRAPLSTATRSSLLLYTTGTPVASCTICRSRTYSRSRDTLATSVSLPPPATILRGANRSNSSWMGSSTRPCRHHYRRLHWYRRRLRAHRVRRRLRVPRARSLHRRRPPRRSLRRLACLH